MKGIVLAGGKGTRLYPLTHTISKQLLPVYDKPMIHYPIKTLIDMGINEILIITADETQLQLFQNQLGSGNVYGVKFSYVVQGDPRGLADAFIIGKDFIGTDDVTLILGDNVFITNQPIQATPNTIFTFTVRNPEAYGVVELNEQGCIKQLIEKPKQFISNQAVVGLYVFDNRVIQHANNLKPSARGELEIVDLIIKMNQDSSLVKVQQLDGFWFDCGTHSDLLECANLIKAIQTRTQRVIGLV